MLTKTVGKTFLMILMLTTASYFVLAASGGGNKKSKAAKSTVSIKKSCSTFNLRSGFQFKGVKINLYQQTKAVRPYLQLNNYTTVQQGNTKMVIPTRHKIGVDNAAQLSNLKKYNHVQVKMLNIKISE
jgi:hypothetical protein